MKAPAGAEFAELMKEHVRARRQGHRQAPAARPLLPRGPVRAKSTSSTRKELAELLRGGRRHQAGCSTSRATMYGLEYTKVTETAWHPDVAVYEVRSGGHAHRQASTSTSTRGADKFKHAAMFPLRTAKRLADGRYQLPEAALECNFPKPPDGPASPPALMTHEDVVDLLPRVRARPASPPDDERARHVLGREHGARLRRGAVADVRGVGVVARGARSRSRATTRRARRSPTSSSPR